MKKMEEDYSERLNTVSGQLVQANQEISKLRYDLEQAHMESKDKMFEMTIVKLEARRAEDDLKRLEESLLASKEVGNQREAVGPSSKSKEIQQEEEPVVLDGRVKNLTLEEVTSQIEILQNQLNAYRCGRRNQGERLDALSKEGPEVLNVDDLLTSDQGNFASQVEEDRRRDAEDGMKSSKDLVELRRENENLRVLYGELEALYKEKQKPEKVARTATHKDPTSRNLKVELEAAAASSPSDEDPELENVHGKMKKRVLGSKARGLKPKSGENTIVKELRKQSEQEVIFDRSEELGNPTLKSASCRQIKKSRSCNKPPVPSSSRRKESFGRNSGESLKEIERQSKEDEGSATIQGLRRAHHESVPLRRSTRKRKADSANCGESQGPPLGPGPINESSYTSVGKPRQQSSEKPEFGSMECKTKSSAKGSGNLMSSLFSAAFSIPRLNIKSSSGTQS